MFFKVLSTENMRRKQEQEWLPWIQFLIPSISLRKKSINVSNLPFTRFI